MGTGLSGAALGSGFFRGSGINSLCSIRLVSELVVAAVDELGLAGFTSSDFGVSDVFGGVEGLGSSRTGGNGLLGGEAGGPE
jgi:hypothetical protein